MRSAATHTTALLPSSHAPFLPRCFAPPVSLPTNSGRKPDADVSAPRFHKFNPGRRGAGAAKFAKAAAAAAAARRRGPESLPGRIPFAHMILTAVIVHRVWTFLSRRLLRKPDAKAAAGSKQLARRRGEEGADGEEEDEEDEEEELDERAEELLSQMQSAVRACGSLGRGVCGCCDCAAAAAAAAAEPAEVHRLPGIYTCCIAIRDAHQSHGQLWRL